MKQENKRVSRVKYFLDEYIQKGNLALILVLLNVVIIVTLIVIILLIVFQVENVPEAIKDSIATIINGWFPDSGSADDIKKYILLIFSAIFGLFITSTLVGIITSEIESRVESIKNCDNPIYFKNHTIILGFFDKNYVLLEEVIKCNFGRKMDILIVDDVGCDEMSKEIFSRMEIPKNIDLHFRTMDIMSSITLEKLNLKFAKNVIINLNTNENTLHLLLSLYSFFKNNNINVPVSAVVKDDDFRIDSFFNHKEDFCVVSVRKLFLKLISQAYMDKNIMYVFQDFFSFDSKELYIEKINSLYGKTFEEILSCINNAMLVGIIKKSENGDEDIIINPKENLLYEKGDKLILCEENKNGFSIEKCDSKVFQKYDKIELKKEDKKKCVIFGYNDKVDELIELIRNDVDNIALITNKKIEKCIKDVDVISCDISDYFVLKEVVKDVQHIIVLSGDDEQDDVYNILTVLRLKDIRDHNKDYQYNIVVELDELDKKDISIEDNNIDFLNANELPSMVLAQISEEPSLIKIFGELLADKGNDIYIRQIKNIDNKNISIDEIRHYFYNNGYIFLGIIDEKEKMVYKLDLDEKILVTNDIKFVLIGRKGM